MEIGDQVMLPQRKTTIKPPWDADPWTVKDVKGSQLMVQRGEKKRLRAKNLVKLVKQRVEDKLINERIRREVEDPECLSIEEIREQLVVDREEQMKLGHPLKDLKIYCTDIGKTMHTRNTNLEGLFSDDPPTAGVRAENHDVPTAAERRAEKRERLMRQIQAARETSASREEDMSDRREDQRH